MPLKYSAQTTLKTEIENQSLFDFRTYNTRANRDFEVVPEYHSFLESQTSLLYRQQNANSAKQENLPYTQHSYGHNITIKARSQ